MRRPAEHRRAQATAEWLVVLIAVGAALTAAGVWQREAIARRLADAIASPGVSTALDDAALDAAIAARPGALSMLGVEAWLADELGAATARRRIAARVAAAMGRDHSGWLIPLELHGPPIRGRRSHATIAATGPIEARVVAFAEERDLAERTTLADRAGAATASLGWAGASSIARRIARPLGLAVSAVQLAAGLLDGPSGLPAGTRAGDIVVCRRAIATIRDGQRPGRKTQIPVWRIGVLRDGRIILDAVAADDRCRAPADR